MAAPADADGGAMTPAYLPELARAVLRRRMASHATDLTTLARAVVLLEYARAAAIAEGIAADASLARPLTGDATELNALLPEQFFDLQEALKASAAAVGSASRARDPERLAEAHGDLAVTCVRCHEVYRRGPPGVSTIPP